MKIPSVFLEIDLSCGECGFISYPDIVMGHLVEQHLYTVAEAEHAIQEWMDDVPQDEEGKPLQECLDHGLFKTVCPQCWQIEHDIAEWQERKRA